MRSYYKDIPLHPLPQKPAATISDLMRTAWKSQTSVVPILNNKGSLRCFNLTTALAQQSDHTLNVNDVLNEDILYVATTDTIHGSLKDFSFRGDTLIIVGSKRNPLGWTTANESLVHALPLQTSQPKDLIVRDQHIFLKQDDTLYVAHKELFQSQGRVAFIVDDDDSLFGFLTDKDISRFIEEGCDIWNTPLKNCVRPTKSIMESSLDSSCPLPPSTAADTLITITDNSGTPTGFIPVETLKTSLALPQIGNKMVGPMPSETQILDTVLNSSLRTGIVGMDEYLNIIYFNDAIMDFVSDPDKVHLGSEIWAVTDSCAISRNAFASYLENARNNHEQVIVNWMKVNDARRYVQCRLSTVDGQDRVAGYVLSVQDITAQRNAEDAIRKLAYQDKLTQLPNRLLFEERLDMEVKRAKRNKARLAIMMLDLDGFKKVNDDYGHTVGDELLCAVGERLLASIRETDTVARFGGDEFIFILPDIADSADADALADKMRKIIGKPCKLSGRTLEVKASLGYAIYPDDSTKRKALLDLADARMYKDKRKEAR